jgi:hypothetical protein
MPALERRTRGRWWGRKSGEEGEKCWLCVSTVFINEVGGETYVGPGRVLGRAEGVAEEVGLPAEEEHCEDT